MFDACICIQTDNCYERLSTTYPVARKPHVCCECHHTIKPGDRYQREANVDAGEVMVFTTCVPCARIRDRLFSHEYMYGEMWSEIHDAFCGDHSDDPYCICPEPEGSDDEPITNNPA